MAAKESTAAVAVSQVLSRPVPINNFMSDLFYENYVANRERSPEVSYSIVEPLIQV